MAKNENSWNSRPTYLHTRFSVNILFRQLNLHQLPSNLSYFSFHIFFVCSFSLSSFSRTDIVTQAFLNHTIHLSIFNIVSSPHYLVLDLKIIFIVSKSLYFNLVQANICPSFISKLFNILPFCDLWTSHLLSSLPSTTSLLSHDSIQHPTMTTTTALRFVNILFKILLGVIVSQQFDSNPLQIHFKIYFKSTSIW